MPCCYCASYWDVSLSIFTLEKVLYTITSPANPLQPIITMATYYDINSSNNYLLTSSRNKTVSLFYVSQEHYSHIRTVKTNSFDDDNKYTYIFVAQEPVLNRYIFINEQTQSILSSLCDIRVYTV